MKFINKQTIIAALVGGLTAIALAIGGVALAHGGPHGGYHGKEGRWSPEKIEEHLEHTAVHDGDDGGHLQGMIT